MKSTSIVTVCAAARKGLQAGVQEPVGGSPTRGHREDQGGLRGHSVDDATYPWRVVGIGKDGWTVKGHAADAWWVGTDIHEAHVQARIARLLHPAGRIETNEDGTQRNISGELDTIPERLAGIAFAVSYKGCDGWPYRATWNQERGEALKVYSFHEACMSHLVVGILARDPRYTIILDEASL